MRRPSPKFRSLLKHEFSIKHTDWREVLRDVQTVREGLDGTSSGDLSAYEALERLMQHVRLENNSREEAECYAEKYWSWSENLFRENLRLEEENERLRSRGGEPADAESDAG